MGVDVPVTLSHEPEGAFRRMLRAFGLGATPAQHPSLSTR